MTLTSYKYKLQFVYDIINGKQSIADARKIFSDEWAAFYGLYVNISTAEQKLRELNTIMHGMNAYNIQMAQKFFETRTVEVFNNLEAFYTQSFHEQKDYEMDYDEEFIPGPKEDISVMYIEDILTHSNPEDVLTIRDAYFKNLNYVERNPYIRSIKKNAFNAFLKEHKYI